MKINKFTFNIIVLMGLSIIFAIGCKKDKIEGSFKDKRDKKEYKTIKIANQTWMAENLNYETGNSWCYDNSITNCESLGRLYDWNTAKTACPKGWKLPTDNDFDILLGSVGGEGKPAFTSLINGGNSKFNALFGGWRNSDGTFYSVGDHGYWWSSSENDAHNAWSLHMTSINQAANVNYYYIKDCGFSVRCLKD